ncbi:MAG: Ankyrin repeat (many copies) [Gammaproteobacteria bacterium]|nr:Ankyrin repeat (many copies) [Gammaproteobacteria bacterium]
MTIARQSTEDLVKASPKKNLFSFPFLGMKDPVGIVFVCLFPEEAIRFSLTSKEINNQINQINNKQAPCYWESQLVIKHGLEREFIQQAKTDPAVDCRRWYIAWNLLFAHAPDNACVPNDRYYYASRFSEHSKADWLRQGDHYPILKRPKFLQLALGGSRLILNMSSDIWKQIPFEGGLAIRDRTESSKAANILHYAAWSGSYEMLMEALNSYSIFMSDFRSTTLLFCAEKSGAVKTDEQRVAVLRSIIHINHLLRYFSAQSGTNLLHDSAKRGAIDILRCFEGKIDASRWLIRSRCGATALHYAAQHAAKSGSNEVIEFLHSLKVGFDPNAQDNDGKTPADWATETTQAAQEEEKECDSEQPQAVVAPERANFDNHNEKDGSLIKREEKEAPEQKQVTAVILVLHNMHNELELEKLQRQINRERVKKTLCSLGVGVVVSVGISYALTGTVLLSVCCIGTVGTLLIALMIHSAYHCRISFFKSAETHRRENELRGQAAPAFSLLTSM